MNKSQPVWSLVSPVGPLLRTQEAAHYMGVSRSSYERMAKAGVVPKPQSLRGHGRARFVPQSWINAVVAANFAPETEQ